MRHGTGIMAILMAVSAAAAVSSATYGVLVEKSSEMYTAPVNALKASLGSAVEEFNMEGATDAGAQFCQKVKGSGGKLIIAVGKNAAKTAIAAVPDMPLVFCMVMNPEDAGLKGSQVTGVSLDIPMDKQFGAFKSVVPALKKVGLVYSDDINESLVKEMKQAASKNSLLLIEKKVASDADVPAAIRDLKGQIDGLYLPPDRMVAKHDAFQFIALFTFENNLPFMAPTDRFVKKGALIALMIDYEEVGKQAAEIAKKVAGGSAAASLPVEPPKVTILVLNQKTAQTIGINIPPGLLEGSMIVK